MRFNDSKTKAFIAHKADIILQNGPLDELAGNGEECFQRLVDIFEREGPKDKKRTNWWCVLDTILRRIPNKVSFKQNDSNSFTILFPNSELSIMQRHGLVDCLLTIPSKGWEHNFYGLYLGTNVGNILAIDQFLPEIIRQADILSMLAQIKLAERDALSPSRSSG